MKRELRVLAAAGSLSLAMVANDAAFARKSGGILKMYSPDSPASMSLRTACSRLFPIWPPAGHGARRGPS
jgi:hypothetical protein